MRFVANAQAIPLKEDYLCALSAGKEILDVGCVNHSYERAMSLGDQWPHKRLKSVAKSVLGIDILQDKKFQPVTMTYTVRDARGRPLAKLGKNWLFNAIRKPSSHNLFSLSFRRRLRQRQGAAGQTLNGLNDLRLL